MNILFIHQNSPGQFVHLSIKLFNLGHNVKFIGMSNFNYEGIESITYLPNRESTKDIHPWLVDFESQVIRGEQVQICCKNLKKNGYFPDLIYFHPGWGEALFISDIWPHSKKIVYCEYYYNEFGFDYGFDKEFYSPIENSNSKLLIKNLANNLQLKNSDLLISPTKFQKSSFPTEIQDKIIVIHDGIDTSICIPNDNINIKLKRLDGSEILLNKNDLVLTFVNRNLEPYRGYHIFMRALPKVMNEFPNLKVLIIGNCNRGYGSIPTNGNWRDIFFREISEKIKLKNIFFLGNISYKNYIKILQISTTHVYLTYPFVLSWSLLEAMSIGCNVVASDTAPVNEFITSGFNGTLVNFFDIDGLSNAVIDTLTNIEDYAQIRSNARKTICDSYDLNNCILPKQIKLLESIIQ